ncbi:MAG: YbgA family protein [Syntrophobacteria bacterium]
MTIEDHIRLGISTCLLGEPVRYDGGHKHDRFITDTLGQFVAFVPVCPEVECGLGVPRESMHLEGDPESPRLLTSRTRLDHTERMVAWARRRVQELEKEDLCGFIFKSNSPSSGMERVRIYNEKGIPRKKGVGVFARVFMEHFSLLPFEEEGRLHDTRLRENFIERVFALKRWRDLLKRNRSRGNLVAFHTEHKLLILSHSPKHHRTMGKLVAEASGIPTPQLYSQYQSLLMEALKLKTTVKKNINVLQHMMGYFKKQLSADEKQELLEIIEQYRQGYVPLIVPLTLVKHYVRKYDQPYLKRQVYLNPHPVELKLRNHV